MDKVQELLTRGVFEIYPSKLELEKLLSSGKKLRLYQGFDPTGIQMHIGHMIGLRKLSQWQNLGHEVIFLIGDGTGQAGDPSGKTRGRDKFLTNEELRQNAKDYVMQATKIVRFEGENPVKILYNGDWLNNLKLGDLLEIAGHFSLQQLSERDMFQDRIKKGETVNLREFLYPLLQAYDSVEMEVDLELGGSDQTFNMLCGRTLIKAMKNRDKFVMTTPLLTDSEGRKIGKTEGNVIALNDEPADLYGKIMSLSDDVILKGLEYLTDVPMDDIHSIEEKLKNGENPMTFKKMLAFDIVKQLNTEGAASMAQKNFEEHFQEKNLKSVDLPTHEFTKGFINSENLAKATAELSGCSISDAKRLISQGAVAVNGRVYNNPNEALSNILTPDENIYQIGKHRTFKVVTKSS